MGLWLQIPYALKIAILTPVCLAMSTVREQGAVFQGAVSASRGLAPRRQPVALDPRSLGGRALFSAHLRAGAGAAGVLQACLASRFRCPGGGRKGPAASRNRSLFRGHRSDLAGVSLVGARDLKERLKASCHACEYCV